MGRGAQNQLEACAKRSRLSAEGLVVAEPQRGFKVAPVSLEDLADLTKARIEIETLCITNSIEAGGVGVGDRDRGSHSPTLADPLFS